MSVAFFSHLGVHPIEVCLVGKFDPFLSLLSNHILDLPLVLLGLTTCDYMLPVNRNHIYGRCFSPIVSRTLIGVVARLVTIEACDGCKVIGLSVVMKIHHYVRIVRRNHQSYGLEGIKAHTLNTSKIYT